MCTGHDDTGGPANMARLSRRGFLRTAATTAAVLGAWGRWPARRSPTRTPPAPRASPAPGPTRPDQHPAVHPARPAGHRPPGTLQALAEIGYTRVEHAGFVGRTVTAFKAALDTAGLWASSGHVPIPQPFDPAA